MAVVYLIPALLAEEGLPAIPAYVKDAIGECRVFFTENERTTRRYFKKLWKEMVIDAYEWHTIGPDSPRIFREVIAQGKTTGIVSEAGLPGIADPGQSLVAVAQESGATVRPLAGPGSIMLALMASGMNGQHFQFVGYLPIDIRERIKAIRDLETESIRKNSTQIFIETPYRNNQLLDTILRNCRPSTRLCIATGLTGPEEKIQTKPVEAWLKAIPDLHKKPSIFLLQGQG